MLRMTDEEFEKMTGSDSEISKAIERICLKLIETAGQNLIFKHRPDVDKATKFNPNIQPKVVAHYEIKRDYET